uniref:Uncharacterized protein n=1 Tax=Chromera velia CCMP2878 TaxID=1169474 RepID=A0A0G4HZ76_9ALVE|eukprot:Cvel_9670.t1-p1 / transcript=Cvel_9670.t1 / gene=Cvel_9670 / organism=Chromera_velia_CCMP2878 / gene_product=hypothetical protein / transcript_product=hypothetical protein / location=Cvel_scaffold563:39835-42294(+) / protein_length=820 / sequence_SO=supercontig / SO=protein_coding / is_pseudo=false
MEAPSLLHLDIENTGIDAEGLKVVCRAIKRTKGRLKLESLNLSENKVGVRTEILTLCEVLRVSYLPCLRSLFLRECEMQDDQLENLSLVIKRGGLPNLEVLDLEGNEGWGGYGLKLIGRVLLRDLVPCLKTLNLFTKRGVRGGAEGSLFLNALMSENAPPSLERVLLNLDFPLDEDLRAISEARVSAVRTLGLTLKQRKLVIFLRDFRAKFDILDLDVCLGMGVDADEGTMNEGSKLLGEVLQADRLSCVRTLKLRATRSVVVDLELGILAEGKRALLRALRVAKLSLLSELSLRQMALSDAEMILLGESVRGSNLVGVRVLDLSLNREGDGSFGREGIEGFMRGVVDSEEGLPNLTVLDISYTRASEAGGVVVAALGSGKLPSVESLGREREFVRFTFDEEDLRVLTEVVKEGKLPARLRGLEFALASRGMCIDSLIRAIAESAVGLPLCVQSLELGGSTIGEEALTLLASCSTLGSSSESRLWGLEVLDLCECGIDDSLVKRLGEVFSVHKCPNLTFLDLQGNQFSPKGLKDFVDILHPDSLPRISELLLNTVYNENPAWLPVVVSGKVPSLERMSEGISEENSFLLLGADEVQILAEGIRHSRFPPRLPSIGFGLSSEGNGINVDPLIEAIGESGVGVPRCVWALSFSGGRLGEEALACLAASGSEWSSRGKLWDLERLELSSCQIGDQTLKRLAEVFSAHGCPKLMDLDLSKNRISLDGLSAFLDTLLPTPFPSLQQIRLDGQIPEGVEDSREGGVSERSPERPQWSDKTVETIRERAVSQKRIPSRAVLVTNIPDGSGVNWESIKNRSGLFLILH